jgi:hypothetical protein
VYAFGAVLRGPRGVKATARGGAFIDTTNTEDGITIRLNSDFLNLPQIPFTRFELKLTNPFFINTNSCGTRDATATVVGHSGASADLSSPYHVNGCLPRPKGATPLRVPLVPAYKQCTSPNSTHGGGLAKPSCTSPSLASGTLTIGTPDANGLPASSTGAILMRVVPGDVALTFRLSDVRNASDLSDYTGGLLARSTLRLSDQANGISGDQPATVQDTAFDLPVPCTPTASPSIGSDCSVDTTANAVVPGVVVAGNRAIWQLSQWQVFDGGPDGNPATADNTVFERQGVFVP